MYKQSVLNQNDTIDGLKSGRIDGIIPSRSNENSDLRQSGTAGVKKSLQNMKNIIRKAAGSLNKDHPDQM